MRPIRTVYGGCSRLTLRIARGGDSERHEETAERPGGSPFFAKASEGFLLRATSAVHPCALGRAERAQDILAAIIRLDEAAALLVVGHFHGSVRHTAPFRVRITGGGLARRGAIREQARSRGQLAREVRICS
jgi:hypothetical protein